MCAATSFKLINSHNLHLSLYISYFTISSFQMLSLHYSLLFSNQHRCLRLSPCRCMAAFDSMIRARHTRLLISAPRVKPPVRRLLARSAGSKGRHRWSGRPQETGKSMEELLRQNMGCQEFNNLHFFSIFPY